MGPGGGRNLRESSSTNGFAKTRRASNAAEQGVRRRTGPAMRMSALVPLRSNGGSLGLFFVEDIALGRDTTSCRMELDQFGAQLALLFERQLPPRLTSASARNTTGNERIDYASATINLEAVPWLRVWNYGRLRTQRETSWYLGLNFGRNNYVIAYCMIAGSESIREHVGSMIWHHLMVVRAISVASGRNRFEASELREEFSLLLASIPNADQLEGITLAFTIFNRETKTAASGHFGSARPFVIGTDNAVSPLNDIVLTYAQGRDLRYWDISASLSGPHTYILSYDTSKLDATLEEAAQRRVASNVAQVQSVDEFHRLLASVVIEANLPRYYLAAVMIEHSGEDQLPPQLPYPPLDKAE
jgi:hypothetical protein